jgi:hypothetical protein
MRWQNKNAPMVQGYRLISRLFSAKKTAKLEAFF